MAIEKQWKAVGPLALTSRGTNEGKITVKSTLDLKVKMVAILSDTSRPKLTLEIKRINSDTELELGPLGNIKERADLTLYSQTSKLMAFEQKRNTIPIQEIERAVYEEEP